MAIVLHCPGGTTTLLSRRCPLRRQQLLHAPACERLTGQQPAALRLPQVAQLSSSRGSVSARAGGSSRDADEQQGTSPGSSARVESHPVAVDGPLDDGWPADEALEAGASAASESASRVASDPFPSEGLAGSSATNSSPSAQQGSVAADPAPPRHGLLDRVPGGAAGRYAAIGTAGFLALTLVIGVVRAVKKFRSPRAVRVQTVNKNKSLVETLSHFYPDNRESFSGGEVRSLKFKTRFSEVEMYRKFLWYLLRERTFDPAAVEDTMHLKNALALSDRQVADAIKERSERIYKKFGSVMLDTEGMTKGGIEKKATCRALFSKLLYLAESEELLPSLGQSERDALVRDVFGATAGDAAKLRIVSLLEVDQDAVEHLAGGGGVEWQNDDGPHDGPPDGPAAAGT